MREAEGCKWNRGRGRRGGGYQKNQSPTFSAPTLQQYWLISSTCVQWRQLRWNAQTYQIILLHILKNEDWEKKWRRLLLVWRKTALVSDANLPFQSLEVQRCYKLVFIQRDVTTLQPELLWHSIWISTLCLFSSLVPRQKLCVMFYSFSSISENVKENTMALLGYVGWVVIDFYLIETISSCWGN